jgi:hypothetical protein
VVAVTTVTAMVTKALQGIAIVITTLKTRMVVVDVVTVVAVTAAVITTNTSYLVV